MPHIIALSIFTIFLLMGAWHGLAWNFIIYGCLHGVGVVSCHYYTIRLKRRLGKKGYAAYNDSLWIRAAGVCATFVFVAITLFFFANSLSATRTIWRVFR
jgi:D-alanyl-lipoteichoic acid acyltransferase DltB (MBOAT superfamily)